MYNVFFRNFYIFFDENFVSDFSFLMLFFSPLGSKSAAAADCSASKTPPTVSKVALQTLPVATKSKVSLSKSSGASRFQGTQINAPPPPAKTYSTFNKF